MIVAGAAQIVSGFSCEKWSGVFLSIALGLLYGVTGFFILENPLEGAAALTLLIAAFFFISGIFLSVVGVLIFLTYRTTQKA